MAQEDAAELTDRVLSVTSTNLLTTINRISNLGFTMWGHNRVVMVDDAEGVAIVLDVDAAAHNAERPRCGGVSVFRIERLSHVKITVTNSSTQETN